MISKIKSLKSIGKFYNFSAGGNNLSWDTKTFIFAPNAYGKSTLVNVLRSLRENNPKLLHARKTLGSTDPQRVTMMINNENYCFNGTKWERSFENIQIFDAPFIHSNILSHEIEHGHKKNIHRIIIGEQGIKIAEELVVLKTSEKNKRQEFDSLVRQFNTASFSHYTIDTFLDIPATEEDDVVVRIQELEKDIKSKVSENTVRGLNLPSVLNAPSFDLSEIKTLASNNLVGVHEAAEKRVLEHITQNIKDRNHAKDFIRQGLELMQFNCPFCGQDLKRVADIIQAYQEFFNDSFREHQSDLKAKSDNFTNWNLENTLTQIISFHHANTTITKQWEQFIGVHSLPDAVLFIDASRDRLKILKSDIQIELEKKKKNLDANIDIALFDDMSVGLNSLKESVAAYNESISAFMEKTRNYVANLPKSDIDTLRKVLAKEREIEKHFKPEWVQWASNYKSAKTDTEILKAKKDAKQKELESYTATIFGDYQKRINELLLTLGTDFKIADLTGKTDERANESYSDFGLFILENKIPLTARQDDSPCFKNTLSEGDKSTLAFAFFVSALEKSPDLEQQIVVLDDPLSSLDETRREATARVLLDLSPKIKQLCVFTHKKDFLWMLCDKMPTNSVLKIRSDKRNGSVLESLDVEEDRKSEHAKMVEGMQRYIDEDFGPTPDMMQGNIRKIFEVVLKTKYYRILVKDIKEKKGFAKLLETILNGGLIDSKLKTKLFDLCNVANGSHHGEIVDAPSKKLSRDELIPLIRGALELLEKV